MLQPEDGAIEKAVEAIRGCQEQLEELNTAAAREVLEVEHKFAKLRHAYLRKRAELTSLIPGFWLTAHPQLSAVLGKEEEECLAYMTGLEVDDGANMATGYKIHIHFDDNPYLENDVITKEVRFGKCGLSCRSTPIRWKAGNDLTQRTHSGATGRKRTADCKYFFNWFSKDIDNGTDEIAEIIREDVWLNPLQYYLLRELSGDSDSNEQCLTSDDDDGDVCSYADDNEIAVEEEV